MGVTMLIMKHRRDATIFDVQNSVTGSITWLTETNYGAGSLKFKLAHKTGEYVPIMGDVVMFHWNGTNVFYGHVFDVSYEGSTVDVTAYDALRYFKNQDSLVWPISTIDQRLIKMCSSMNLKYKVINSSTYKLPTKISDQKTYFDMFQDDVNKVWDSTGTHYFLRDNYGTVELVNSKQTMTKLILGDSSLVTGFEYTESIDNAINSVKVIRDDKHTTKRKVVTYTYEKAAVKKGKTKSVKKKIVKPQPGQPKPKPGMVAKKHTKTERTTTTTQTVRKLSGDSTLQWGVLQQIEKVDSGMNDAQMLAKAKQILRDNNKVAKKLTLHAVGILGVRAGTGFYIDMAHLRDVGVSSWPVFPHSVTHNFGDTWTMDIEVNM